MFQIPLRRMLRLAALAGLAGLAGCVETLDLEPPEAALIQADAHQVVDPREIIALVPSQGAAERLDAEAQAQGFVPREIRSLDGIGLWMLRFDIPPPLDGPGAIAALEAIEPLSTAGVNHAYRLASVAGASRFDYASALMNWPDTACPAQGPIGMLDTALDPSLGAALGSEIVSKDFASGAPVRSRHGSEVATVLLDRRRLQGATLYAANVIGTSPRGQQEAGVDDLLKALDWLATQNVRLVNVSLAGPYNKLLDRGVDRAVSGGMTIVAAVGNDGAGAAPRYPAALSNVIAVTAVDADREIYSRAVRGPHVDAAAPGVDIFVSASGTSRFVSGTSMAVPFVTARIAADPDLYAAPTAAIRRGLQTEAEDLGIPGRDTVYGAGLVTAGSGC
ncbi:MAG: S8 family serine peptidase [Pseudomonadota bacterium]